MAQEERVKFLTHHSVPQDRPVVYWMQTGVRTRSNHALEYAIHLANHRDQMVYVVFCLTPGYPGANERHYRFLIEGLNDVCTGLEQRRIPFFVYVGDMEEFVRTVSTVASTLVVDRGYLRHHRRWRSLLAEHADCPIVQVESNVIVPVETASPKEEYSAATIRKKIHGHLDRFLVQPQPVPFTPHDTNETAPFPTLDRSFDLLTRDSIGEVLEGRIPITDLFAVDRSVPPSPTYTGGEKSAYRHLATFVDTRLLGYAEGRNVPGEEWASNLSPYLHFGHISPIDIAIAAIERGTNGSSEIGQDDVDAFLEELIVRRELAINFTEYNSDYDTFASLPDWAKKTLGEHGGDPRPATYALEELEQGKTDDPYWNACQNEMVQTGKMHGYMRMYWGKKILEWTDDPAEAYRRAIYLNDRYELDGREPNGYAGVAWIFGKHDRPWVERPVFGKVRYMNANGLRRKFKNIDSYIQRWTSDGAST